MNKIDTQTQQKGDDDVAVMVAEKPVTRIAVTIVYNEGSGEFHLIKKKFKDGEEKLICNCLKVNDLKIAREAAEVAISKGEVFAKIEPGSILLDWEDKNEKFTGFIFYAKVYPGLRLSSFKHDEEYLVVKLNYSALLKSTKVTMLTKHCVKEVFKKFIQ